MLLGLFLVPQGAMAHALEATYKIDATAVHVEVFYDTDDVADGAKVTVVDAAGQTIAAGVTDDKGRWSFPRPAAGQYRIEVDAGLGHRKRLRVTIPIGPDDATPVQATRAELTRFPWLGLTTGLVVIAVLGVGTRIFLKRQRT